MKDNATTAQYACYETCPVERLWFAWLWSQGMSFRSIAKHAGRSPTTVRRWVRRMLGEETVTGGRIFSPSEIMMASCCSSYDTNITKCLQCVNVRTQSAVDCFNIECADNSDKAYNAMPVFSTRLARDVASWPLSLMRLDNTKDQQPV